MKTETLDKIKVFENEYTYIKNEKYVESLKTMVGLLPDYFFEVAASSTGKYHPEFSLGKGGLVRHTKSLVRIAIEFYNNESLCKYTQDEMDLMLVAMILHDGLKAGLIPDAKHYTKVEHPLLICDYIKKNKNKLTFTDEEIEFLSSIIAPHMGPWNTDWNGNEVLPKPKDKYQRFVHMCDYLASRKFLNIKFENDNIVE